MPSILKEELKVIVGVDTSGSVSMKEYKEFMSEVIGIINSFSNVKMKLITWDTRCSEPINITNQTSSQIMNATFGGGGTDINCFFEDMIENHSEAKLAVILTDGYFGHINEEPNADLVYVLTNDGYDKDIQGGTVIKLDRR